MAEYEFDIGEAAEPLASPDAYEFDTGDSSPSVMSRIKNTFQADQSIYGYRKEKKPSDYVFDVSLGPIQQGIHAVKEYMPHQIVDNPWAGRNPNLAAGLATTVKVAEDVVEWLTIDKALKGLRLGKYFTKMAPIAMGRLNKLKETGHIKQATADIIEKNFPRYMRQISTGGVFGALEPSEDFGGAIENAAFVAGATAVLEPAIGGATVMINKVIGQASADLLKADPNKYRETYGYRPEAYNAHVPKLFRDHLSKEELASVTDKTMGMRSEMTKAKYADDTIAFKELDAELKDLHIQTTKSIIDKVAPRDRMVAEISDLHTSSLDRIGVQAKEIEASLGHESDSLGTLARLYHTHNEFGIRNNIAQKKRAFPKGATDERVDAILRDNHRREQMVAKAEEEWLRKGDPLKMKPIMDTMKADVEKVFADEALIKKSYRDKVRPADYEYVDTKMMYAQEHSLIGRVGHFVDVFKRVLHKDYPRSSAEYFNREILEAADMSEAMLLNRSSALKEKVDTAVPGFSDKELVVFEGIRQKNSALYGEYETLIKAKGSANQKRADVIRREMTDATEELYRMIDSNPQYKMIALMENTPSIIPKPHTKYDGTVSYRSDKPSYYTKKELEAQLGEDNVQLAKEIKELNSFIWGKGEQSGANIGTVGELPNYFTMNVTKKTKGNEPIVIDYFPGDKAVGGKQNIGREYANTAHLFSETGRLPTQSIGEIIDGYTRIKADGIKRSTIFNYARELRAYDKLAGKEVKTLMTRAEAEKVYTKKILEEADKHLNDFRIYTGLPVAFEFPEATLLTGKMKDLGRSKAIKPPKPIAEMTQKEAWAWQAKLKDMQQARRGAMKEKTVMYVHPDASVAFRQILQNDVQGPIINALEVINGVAKTMNLAMSLFHFVTLGESHVFSTWGRKGKKMIPRKFSLSGITRQMKDVQKEIANDQQLKYIRELNGETGPMSKSAKDDLFITKMQDAFNKFADATADIPVVGRMVKMGTKAHEKLTTLLWDHFHTGLKAYHLKKNFNEHLLRNPNASHREAAREAQLMTDNMFGGQNWKRIYSVSPRQLQKARLMMLAPDWTVSQLRVAAGMIGAKDKSSREAYMKYNVYGWATYLALHDMMNYVSSGHHLWDNEWDRKLDVSLGKQKNMIPTAFVQMFGYEAGSEKQVYTHMGKQLREVFGWFTDPLKTLGNKASPILREAYRQITSSNFGSTYPVPWDEGQVGADNPMAERLKSLMGTFTPFSLGGSQIAFSLPMRKGMNFYKGTDAIQKIIDAPPEQRSKSDMRDILHSLEMNGIDPEPVFSHAVAQVNKKYYRKFFKALQRKSWDEAADIAFLMAERQLITLDGFEMSMEKQSLSDSERDDAIAALRKGAKRRGLFKTKGYVGDPFGTKYEREESVGLEPGYYEKLDPTTFQYGKKR